MVSNPSKHGGTAAPASPASRTALGQHANSVLYGPMVAFHSEELPAIKAHLAEPGYTVIERPDLRMELES